MAIVSISRIQHRRGLQQDLPLLASAEFGWSLDSQRLFIGNGNTAEGAPRLGITEILTEHSDVLTLAETYNFKNLDAGYAPVTGGKNNRFNSIAYGNSTYVTVGVNGSIAISHDNVTWIPVFGGTTNTLNSICYSNGLFVAVGANGTIIYSADGLVWNKPNFNVFVTYTSIVYASLFNVYVAVTSTGQIINITSATVLGITTLTGYTNITSGVTSSLNSVSYYNGTVAISGNAGVILYSTNGSSYTQTTTPTSYTLRNINYVNSQWMAIGDYSTVLTSSDCITWNYGFTDTFRGAANNGSLWVLVGDGGIIYNIDTTDPQMATTPVATTSPTSNHLNDVVYSATDGQFVIVGDSGKVLTSSDGIAWNTQTSGVSTNLNKILYDSTNDLYVAVGDTGTLIISNNGSTWISQTTNTSANLNCIAVWPGTNLTYIAVGDSGTVITSHQYTNPMTWTARTSGITANLYSVTVGNNTAVAVGAAGNVIISNLTASLGATWLNSISHVSDDIYSVNYISWVVNAVTYSEFFGVGNNAVGIASVDGTTWFNLDLPSTNHLSSIVYGIDNFWILGSVGYSTIYGNDVTNMDTLTYQSLAILNNNTTGQNGPTLYSSSYGATRYVIVGQYDTILASTDGINFVSQPQPTFTSNDLKVADILSITYQNSIFTAVGNKGLILTSTNASSWAGTSYQFGENKTIRTLQNKLDDFVSVKDFGAKGDGLSDDTESINRALYELYCRTLVPNARKILWFPAGKYIVSDAIKVPSYAVLRGEGSNNTIIVQTADPSYVSYVMTTADTKQQIGAQIGYNGASLPSDISIHDIGLESNADGFWLVNAKRVTLDKITMTGLLDMPDSIGNENTGLYIIGSTNCPPTDINVTDCTIQNYNYCVYQPDTEYSSNIIFESTTFYNSYIGLELCVPSVNNGLGVVNTMTISNCIFDLISYKAIEASNVINITSAFNSYRDVGNGYRGQSYPSDIIIDFNYNNNGTSVGCFSFNDEFDRSATTALTYPWVNGNSTTSTWFGGHNLRVGYFSQQGGEVHTLTANQSNKYVTLLSGSNLSYLIGNNTFNQKIQYVITRGNNTRSGRLQLSYNSISGNYSIDDDCDQTGDVGVTFGLESDGTYLYLKYTSDNSVAGTFKFAIAESYVKTAW